MFAGRTDHGKVRVSVPLLQRHDLLVRVEPQQTVSWPQLEVRPVVTLGDHDEQRPAGPALEDQLVEAGPFHLGAKFAAAGKPLLDTLRGLYAEKQVRNPVITLLPVSSPVLTMRGFSGWKASETSRVASS